jgi:hypothetical protein
MSISDFIENKQGQNIYKNSKKVLQKGHGGIFLRNFFLRLDISYIYIWIVLEVLYTNIYAINYFHCFFLYRGDIEHWSILGHF